MELNRYLDHTLLRPDATRGEIERLCAEGLQYQFRAIVVTPAYLPIIADCLAGSTVAACTVVGFPLGGNTTEIKIAEAVQAEERGAGEIDIVANLGWLQDRQAAKVVDELAQVRRRLSSETVFKVIIETPLITPSIWPEAVEAVIDSGADFVKTATGFFGATTRRHVEQISTYVDGRIKIKAAGGIRTAADAMAMIMVGAARIGSSSSVAIMKGLESEGDNGEKRR